jgi:hypothetical protein
MLHIFIGWIRPQAATTRKPYVALGSWLNSRVVLQTSIIGITPFSARMIFWRGTGLESSLGECSVCADVFGANLPVCSHGYEIVGAQSLGIQLVLDKSFCRQMRDAEGFEPIAGEAHRWKHLQPPIPRQSQSGFGTLLKGCEAFEPTLQMTLDANATSEAELPESKRKPTHMIQSPLAPHACHAVLRLPLQAKQSN